MGGGGGEDRTVRARGSEGEEGLRNVVVRAAFEPRHAIGLLDTRGHHDDRNVDAFAQGAAHAGAFGPGEHEVEQDDVGTSPHDLGDRSIPAVDQVHLDGVRLEVLRGQPREAHVVLDVHDADARLILVVHARESHSRCVRRKRRNKLCRNEL